jgi:hypothetical protein
LLIAVIILALATPGTALAHEGRDVGGKYRFVVGFLNEPAVTGQVNGIDLRVSVPTENDRPVEGLEATLRATIIVGGEANVRPVELQPRFGQPGAYQAAFIPPGWGATSSGSRVP